VFIDEEMMKGVKSRVDWEKDVKDSPFVQIGNPLRLDEDQDSAPLADERIFSALLFTKEGIGMFESHDVVFLATDLQKVKGLGWSFWAQVKTVWYFYHYLRKSFSYARSLTKELFAIDRSDPDLVCRTLRIWLGWQGDGDCGETVEETMEIMRKRRESDRAFAEARARDPRTISQMGQEFLDRF
jgi:hypothetical protein